MFKAQVAEDRAKYLCLHSHGDLAVGSEQLCIYVLFDLGGDLLPSCRGSLCPLCDDEDSWLGRANAANERDEILAVVIHTMLLQHL